MERRGSGLHKIVEETSKLPGYTDALKPQFSSTPTNFTVTLKNINYGDEPINEPINELINEPINEKQIKIFNAIKANPDITYDELSEGLKVSLASVKRSVSLLKKAGYIVRSGSNKSGHWEILK